MSLKTASNAYLSGIIVKVNSLGIEEKRGTVKTLQRPTEAEKKKTLEHVVRMRKFHHESVNK